MRRLDAIASLYLRFDRGSPTSLQHQICDGLRSSIAAGLLAPGARLPSTRSLAAQLAVSRTTIVAALEQLVGEGYLTTSERSGVFVAPALPIQTVAPAPPAVQAGSTIRLARRMDELAHEAGLRQSLRPRPLAFRLSRPALDAFPVREWSRILSRRSARVSVAQLDYGQESRELRAVIAELASSSRGMRVHADQVLLFSGGQRALEFAAAAVLEPGDRALMEDPGYPGARNVLRSVGAAVTYVPVDDQGMIVPQGIAHADDARLVYTTPSCQFPLGVTMSMARRHELLAWAERTNACIIEDDYDCEFGYADAPLAALHGLDDAGRVFYVSSFSRTMFPAIRLGFLVAPAALVDRLRAARATLEEPLPSLMQLALADFIAEGHFVRHLRRMRVVYRERRDALVAAAHAAGEHRMRVRPTTVGLHVIADLPDGVDPTSVSALAAQRGVEAAPLSQFYAEHGPGAPALVLGFGAVRPDLAQAAIDKLVAAIDEAAASR